MQQISHYNFRDIDRKYLYIETGGQYAMFLGSFADEIGATGILAYGFVDHEEGLQFEVLCKAYYNAEKHGIKFAETNAEAQVRLPWGLLQSFCGFVIPEHILPIANYKTKVEKIGLPDEAILSTRAISMLDGCRKQENPDEVLVYLSHEDQAEGCYVRLEGVGKMNLTGVLLSEPQQDYGVHVGNRLDFFIVKNEQGLMCLAPR